MNRLLYPVSLLLLLLLCHETSTAQSVPRVKEILLREESAARQITSLVYDVHLGRSNSGRTTARDLRIFLRRHTLNDGIGFHVRIEDEKGRVITYDGARWLSLNPAERKGIDLTSRGSFHDYLNGNQSGGALLHLIRERGTAVQDAPDEMVEKMVTLEGIVNHDGRSAYSLRSAPSEGGEGLVTHSTMHQHIDSASGLLLLTETSAEISGLPYADTLRITRLQIDPPLHDTLFSPIIPADWQFETATPLEEEERPQLLAVDSPAPDWSLTDLRGRTVSLHSLRGRVVVLDFWYSSCGPCLMAMPALQRLQKRFGKKVAVVGVNVHDSAAIARRVMTARKCDYTVVVDGMPVAESYHVTGYPTLYIIDRKGRISHASAGYGDGVEEELAGEIERALKKR